MLAGALVLKQAKNSRTAQPGRRPSCIRASTMAFPVRTVHVQLEVQIDRRCTPHLVWNGSAER